MTIYNKIRERGGEGEREKEREERGIHYLESSSIFSISDGSTSDSIKLN